MRGVVGSPSPGQGTETKPPEFVEVRVPVRESFARRAWRWLLARPAPGPRVVLVPYEPPSDGPWRGRVALRDGPPAPPGFLVRAMPKVSVSIKIHRAKTDSWEDGPTMESA